jgi:hypothetical protein
MASYKDVNFNPHASLGLEFGPVHENGPEEEDHHTGVLSNVGGRWFSWGSTETREQSARLQGYGCKVIGYRGQKCEGGRAPPEGTLCGGGHGVRVGDIVVAVNSRAVVSQSFSDIMDVIRDSPSSGYLDPSQAENNTTPPQFHRQKRIRFLSWDSHESIKTALVLNRLTEGKHNTSSPLKLTVSPEGSPSLSELESLLRLQKNMNFSDVKDDYSENISPNVPTTGTTTDKQRQAFFSLAKKVTFSPDVSCQTAAGRNTVAPQETPKVPPKHRQSMVEFPLNKATPKKFPSQKSLSPKSPSDHKISGAGMTPQPLSGQSRSPSPQKSPSPITVGSNCELPSKPASPSKANVLLDPLKTSTIAPFGTFFQRTPCGVVDPDVFQSATTPIEHMHHQSLNPTLTTPVYTLPSSMLWQSPDAKPLQDGLCIHPQWFGYTPPAVSRAIPLTPQTIPTPQDRQSIICCVETLRDAMSLLSLRFGDNTANNSIMVDPSLFQSTTTPVDRKKAPSSNNAVDTSLLQSAMSPPKQNLVSSSSSFSASSQHFGCERRVTFSLAEGSPQNLSNNIRPSSSFQRYQSPLPGRSLVSPNSLWDEHMQHMELMSLIIQDCRMNLKSEGLPEIEIDEQISDQISAIAQLLYSARNKSKQEHDQLQAMVKLISPISSQPGSEDSASFENGPRDQDNDKERLQYALTMAEAEVAQLKNSLQLEQDRANKAVATLDQFQLGLECEKKNAASAVDELQAVVKDVAQLKVELRDQKEKAESATAEVAQYKQELERERTCAAALADELHTLGKDHHMAVEQCKTLSTRLMSKMGMADAEDNDVKRLEEVVHTLTVCFAIDLFVPFCTFILVFSSGTVG